MREVVLKANGLTKKYGKQVALDSANMEVHRGDIYGLIGRNGAGKTTMMKIICGLTNPTGGEFEIFGKSGTEVEKERSRIGCLIENPAFFGYMTAYENLRYYCYQKGIVNLKQIDEVLELVGLTEARNKKFKAFSLGMKQRLGIAFALLDNPELVILDEPINGLDPIGISELREVFVRLAKEKGVTIVISSHILSELYATADHFLFVEKGHVLKDYTKEQLDTECSKCLVLKTNNTKKAATVLEMVLDVNDYKVINDEEIRIYKLDIDIPMVSKRLIENDVAVLGLFEAGVSLEEFFKQLVEA